MSNLPAGLKLEHLVSDQLDRLGIEYEHFIGDDPMNVVQKVDFRLHSPIRDYPMDFQITLRQGMRNKIRGFVGAALETAKRGTRVYLEIIASKAMFFRDAERLARAIAKTMRQILFSYSQFEAGNLLGIRVRVTRKGHTHIKRFSLLYEAGRDWVIRKVQTILARRANSKKAWWCRYKGSERSIAGSLRLDPPTYQNPLYVPARTFIPRRMMRT